VICDQYLIGKEGKKMDINKLSIEQGSDVHYSKGFMDVMEAHVDFLKNSTKSTKFIVDKDIAYIYQGDFFGYMNYRNVPQKYHWICMRVNGYFSSFEFKPDVDTLIIPNTQELEQIRISYLNSGLVNF
jgi:hypothetical protein